MEPMHAPPSTAVALRFADETDATEATAADLDLERPCLLALARRLARNPHDADDLVQEALVRALPALGKVAAGSHLRAWLLTILRRIHIDQLRRAARAPEEASIDDVHDVLVADEPLGESCDAPEVEHLRRALAAIPPPFREVLVLHELEGQSYRQIAKQLELPLATVGTRLSRARHKLRALLTLDAEVPIAANTNLHKNASTENAGTR